MHLEAEHYFILILIQILASHQISPRDWPKCSECCENIISALTNIKAVGHMQKIKHICWRLVTQSTHTGQETDHADSTALKWGTWFISYQSRTVMPNTGLNSDLIVQIQQFWLKVLNMTHRTQVRKKACAEWEFARCMYCIYFKSATTIF